MSDGVCHDRSAAEAELVSPQYEDAGLFRADICTLDLTLQPGVGQDLDRTTLRFGASPVR